MALTKKDLQAIEGIFDGIAKKIMGSGRRKAKDLTKLTMKRLYGYPLLKKNIERYKLDIEDIKREDMGKSKSIVMFTATGGKKPDLEELRAAKIRLVELKIDRDEKEIAKIDAALSTIKDDEYYPIIEMRFFRKCGQEEIAKAIPCGTATVSRQLGRLLDILNISLYGADAFAK